MLLFSQCHNLLNALSEFKNGKKKVSSHKIYGSPFGGIPEVTKDIKQYVLDSVEKNIKRGGDQEFIIDSVNPSKKMTYSQLKENIAAIEAFLHSIGFEKGDVCTGFMSNCVEYPAIYTAVLGRGGIFTGPTDSSSGWMEDHLRKTKTKVIFVTPNNLLKILDEVAKVECVKAVVLVNFPSPHPSGGRFVPFETVAATKGEAPPVEIAPDDMAVFAYSSGSTGPPKLTILSHRNLMSCMFASEKYQLDVAVRDIFPELEEKDRRKMLDVRYVHFLVYAQLYGMMWMLRALTCTMRIALSPLEADPIVKALHKYKPWHVTFSPRVFNMLVPRSDVDLSFVRHATSSGTALRPEILKILQERYPKLMVVPGIGMTETAGACMNMLQMKNTPSPAYVPSPGMEARLINSEGKDIEGENEWGEMLLRGPAVTKGYFNDPQKTKEAIDEDGWYHTGDVCYVNENKEFVYIDRLKAIINVGKEKVSSAELERIMMRDSRLKDVGVLGVPHKELGEVPRAFVVPADSSLKEEEVVKMVMEKTPQHMWLLGGVRFVEMIPRDVAGKAMRYTLRKLYSQ